MRAESAKNQNFNDFGLTTDINDKQILNRTRINLSINPIHQIKGFIQGQFYLREGDNDYSKARLYQAYIDMKIYS